MTATIDQQQIAKELCLKMLDKGMYADFSRENLGEIEYNTKAGEQVGTLYLALLAKVCETDEL